MTNLVLLMRKEFVISKPHLVKKNFHQTNLCTKYIQSGLTQAELLNLTVVHLFDRAKFCWVCAKSWDVYRKTWKHRAFLHIFYDFTPFMGLIVFLCAFLAYFFLNYVLTTQENELLEGLASRSLKHMVNCPIRKYWDQLNYIGVHFQYFPLQTSCQQLLTPSTAPKKKKFSDQCMCDLTPRLININTRCIELTSLSADVFHQSKK